MSDVLIRRFVLRDLSVATRIVIAAFLLSVGVGYFSALVQLHFQGASPGKLLPENKDIVATYHGRPLTSQLERLLVSDESKPFNGSGSMRAAFTTRSGGLPRAVKDKAKEMDLDVKQPDGYRRARQEVFRERDGERLVLLDWIRKGADQKAYDDDSYARTPQLASHPISDKFLNDDGVKTVKIRSILEDRCVRCHGEGVGGPAADFPLDTYERVHAYCELETVGGGMSLVKLAQTTHVHLLGFAMLYGLTGMIFTFSSWPGWLRLVVGPLPLIAQVVDISLWWFSRTDARLAQYIQITGAIVAVSLFLQIMLSLFDLFDKKGKVIMALVIVLGCVGGYTLQRSYIGPYLEKEREGAVPAERTGDTGE